jgi:transcriptional regulator with XRE-family HTH domain
MRKGTPYQQLGRKLGEIRRRLQESLPEVSGAVELESEVLNSYERGEARPSEDVLLLLISHFEIKDDEADELWELAGYNNPSLSTDESGQMPTIVMVPMDNRIIYTDSAQVTINNYGVVMNFMQNGLHNQPAAIARIGMSLEHAKSVLEVLASTIAKAESAKQPKQLPSSLYKKAPKKHKQ